MSNERVPRAEAEFVDWLRDRVALWTGGQSGPPDIGLTAAQIATLSGLSATLDDKYQQLKDLKAQKKAARVEKDTALEAARAMLGGSIEIIDGYAKTTSDPDVYARAQIDPPRPRTPRSEAPVPTNLALRSTTNGRLVLSFDANKGLGSVFVIQRRIKPIGQNVGPFTYMDTTGQKSWTDEHVPGGIEWVGYQVATKLTNNVRSDWSDERVFNFGTIGGESAGAGGETITIDQAQKLKDAQTAKGKDKAG
ncbi:MAG: hypothetical protein RIB58_11010 [Phycisphaerales bacterium]